MHRFPCTLIFLLVLALPQPGLAQPSMAQTAIPQPGIFPSGMTQSGMTQPGLAQGLFISREQLDLAMLLAPPPGPDSAEQKQEIDTLLSLQEHRTPADEAVAMADSDQSVFRFADAFGPEFRETKLPKTAALFTKAASVASFLVPAAQERWNRARPFAANQAIHPCLVLPKSPSYPSGNATFGALAAVLLTNMIPEKQEAIFQRARQYGQSRLIGGVHYPSDVAAGTIAGTAIAAVLLQNPAFRTEFDEAKTEVRGVLGMQ